MVSVTVKKTPVKTRIPSSGGSRYQRLVDTIDALAVEEIATIDLWSRSHPTAGRFKDTGVALDIVHDSEVAAAEAALPISSRASEDATPEELADQLFELAREFEDDHGPQTFQARINPSNGHKYTPCTFTTSDTPGGSDVRDETTQALSSVGRTLRVMDKTMASMMKRLEEALRLSREMGPSPETAAVVAKAKVEMEKLRYEHEHDDAFLEIMDKRLEQLVGEVGPGLRDFLHTEPTMNNQPDRMREWLEDLTEDETERFRAAVGENNYSILRAGSDAPTNVDYRATMDKFRDELAIMEKSKRAELMDRITEAIPRPKFRRLGRLLGKIGM